MKKKPYMLNALVVFECLNDPTGKIYGCDELQKNYSAILNLLALPFEVSTHSEKGVYSKFGYKPPIIVSFLVKKELSSVRKAYYIQQLMNGYAGICLEIKGVESFSYSVF